MQQTIDYLITLRYKHGHELQPNGRGKLEPDKKLHDYNAETYNISCWSSFVNRPLTFWHRPQSHYSEWALQSLEWTDG